MEERPLSSPASFSNEGSLTATCSDDYGTGYCFSLITADMHDHFPFVSRSIRSGTAVVRDPPSGPGVGMAKIGFLLLVLQAVSVLLL